MVSIIIVAMGVDDELRACLASLRTHVQCAHELILVNNGATPLGLAAETIIENPGDHPDYFVALPPTHTNVAVTACPCRPQAADSAGAAPS